MYSKLNIVVYYYTSSFYGFNQSHLKSNLNNLYIESNIINM